MNDQEPEKKKYARSELLSTTLTELMLMLVFLLLILTVYAFNETSDYKKIIPDIKEPEKIIAELKLWENAKDFLKAEGISTENMAAELPKQWNELKAKEKELAENKGLLELAKNNPALQEKPKLKELIGNLAKVDQKTVENLLVMDLNDFKETFTKADTPLYCWKDSKGDHIKLFKVTFNDGDQLTIERATNDEVPKQWSILVSSVKTGTVSFKDFVSSSQALVTKGSEQKPRCKHWIKLTTKPADDNQYRRMKELTNKFYFSLP